LLPKAHGGYVNAEGYGTGARAKHLSVDSKAEPDRRARIEIEFLDTGIAACDFTLDKQGI
jgi:hypothetical protein